MIQFERGDCPECEDMSYCRHGLGAAVKDRAVFRFHKATAARKYDTTPDLTLHMDLERDEAKPPDYRSQGQRLAHLLLNTMPTATLQAMVATVNTELAQGG